MRFFRQETERMREAYRLQPDSIEGAEKWELPEEWTDEQFKVWWADPPQSAGRRPVLLS